MSSYLPENLKAVLVKDLRDGEVGYTVPWAMWADASGRLWLNGLQPVLFLNGCGTACMKVQRKGDQCIVYRETIPDWQRYQLSAHVFEGQSADQLPVELK